MDEVEVLMRELQQRCDGTGVTCHPFLVGWYNEMLSPSFHLPHNPQTLAVLLVSTPSMFENLFIPFLRSPQYSSQGQQDPLDQCFKHFFAELKSLFPTNQIEAIHDYEVSPVTRKPRVLVQTAGHVAGAAYYYQRADVNPDPWPKERRLYGVSVHPKYGGWFAFRGVLVFTGVFAPGLTQPEPPDCVPSQAMRQDLLHKFNTCWQDWSYRDVVMGGAKEKYSDEQRSYFGTEPNKRLPLVAQLQSVAREDTTCTDPPPHVGGQ